MISHLKLKLSYALLSFLGFLDATYLTITHYTGGILPCAIGSCEQVTSSIYATIGPIPVALLGIVYYLAILLFTTASLAGSNDVWLQRAAKLSVIGLLASLWFIFAQAFLIKAWCLYCLGSALISTLLFLIGLKIKCLPTPIHE